MKSQVKDLFSLGLVYSLAGFLEKGVHFVFLPVYTYFLKPNEYGIIAMMMLTVNLITPLFQTPAAAGVQRSYFSSEYRGINKELVFLGFACILGQGIVFAALFFLFSRWISLIVLDNASFIPVVKVFAVILLCEPISQYFLMLIKLQKKVYHFMFISLSSAVLFSLLVIYLLVEKDLGYMALAYGRLLQPAYVLLIGFCFLLRDMKLSFKLSYLKPLLAYGYPFVISSLSFFLINSSDRFVLRIFSPLQIVGLFVFASQFTLIFKTLLVFPIKNALTPLVLEMEDDPESIRTFLYRSANYFCMICFLVWLFLALFSKELVQLMARNPSYWSAWPIVPIVTLSTVILGLNDYCNKGIVMTKKTSLITFTYLFGCTMNIALNFLFIPWFGAIGAAVATCLAIIAFTGMNAYYSYRLYSLTFDFRKLGSIFFAAGLIAVVGLGFNRFSLLTALSVKLLLIILFPVLLFYAGVLSRVEINDCRAIVSRSKIGKFLYTKFF